MSCYTYTYTYTLSPVWCSFQGRPGSPFRPCFDRDWKNTYDWVIYEYLLLLFFLPLLVFFRPLPQRPATEALPQQGLVCGTVCYRIYATKNSVFGASGACSKLTGLLLTTAQCQHLFIALYKYTYLLTYLLCTKKGMTATASVADPKIWKGGRRKTHFPFGGLLTTAKI